MIHIVAELCEWFFFLSSSEALYSLVCFIISGGYGENEDVNNEENRFAPKLLANQSRYLREKKENGIIAALPLT